MGRIKKSGLAMLIVLIFATMITITGCGKAEEKTASGDNSTGAVTEVEGTVKIAGSTSVQPLAEELADAFMEENEAVTVSVQGGGSSAGIESADKGTAQIGTSSREIKEEEKSLGLTETVIARDGIAVITNAENKLNNLTLEQTRKIFSGEVKDWSEVGGAKGPITVVVREEGSGTRGAFEEIVLGKGTRFIANAVVQNSTGAVKTAVSKDVNGIGFISLGSVDAGVKAVTVDGVAPSEATVIDGSYKVSRPFLFLTKGKTDAASKAFIDFVLSAEGQKIVSDKYVKVN